MIRKNRITKKSRLKTKYLIKAVVTAIFLALIMVSSSTEAQISSTPVIGLKLDLTQSRIFSETKNAITITPGESKADEAARIEREKKEAEAKTKAVVARNVAARESRTYSPPVNLDLNSVYKTAASRYGIADWRILQAIHYVETGCDTFGDKYNPSGATGPMQFLPSTWSSWGVDGDGDGVADIHNVVDAIHGAAHYLAVSGGTTDIRKALYSYNHSTSYVNEVLSVAESIAQ